MISRLYQIIDEHRIALATGLIVGVLAVMPYIIPAYHLGLHYQGIPFLYQDSEDLYLARLEEIKDGNFSISSPHQFEYKSNEQAMMLPFIEWIYGAPVFLGADPAWVVICMRFVIPFFLFVCVYFLVRRVIGNEGGYVTAAGTCAGVLFVQGVEYIHPSYVIDVVTGNYHAPVLNIWTRIANPGTGALLVLVTLLLIERLRERQRTVVVLLLGVVVALQLGYIFAFILSGLLLGAHTVFAIVQKQKQLALALVSAGLFALFVNAHYLIGVILPDAAVVGEAAKNGMLITHEPMMNKLVLAVICLLVLAWAVLSFLEKRVAQHKDLYWSATVLGALFVSFNIQLVFGKAVWPQHFVQYSIPLSLVVLVLLAARVARELNFEKMFIFGSYTIVALSMLFSAYSISTIGSVYNDYFARQEAAQVLAFFKTVEAPCVVLVSEGPQFLNRMIPAYTPCDTYMTSYIYATPRARIANDYYVRMLLDGVTPKTRDEYIRVHADDTREYLSTNWGQLFSHQGDAWLERVYPKARATEELSVTREAVRAGFDTAYQSDLYELITKNRVDYFVVDTRLRGIPRSLKSHLAYVADKGYYRIFRVK